METIKHWTHVIIATVTLQQGRVSKIKLNRNTQTQEPVYNIKSTNVTDVG